MDVSDIFFSARGGGSVFVLKIPRGVYRWAREIGTICSFGVPAPLKQTNVAISRCEFPSAAIQLIFDSPNSEQKIALFLQILLPPTPPPPLASLFLDFLAFFLGDFPCFSRRVTPKILGKKAKTGPKKQGKSQKEKSKEIRKSKERGIRDLAIAKENRCDCDLRFTILVRSAPLPHPHPSQCSCECVSDGHYCNWAGHDPQV